MFKWVIQIGKKRRGLWRPPMTIRIFATSKGNELNIDPSYKFPIWFYSEAHYQRCRECSSGCVTHERAKTAGMNLIIHEKIKFFDSENGRNNKYYRICGDIVYLRLPDIEDIFEGYSVTLYPEWRPGKPDYSDYVEWLAENVLNPCIAEFERRWAEAMESEETEAVEFTSDHYSFQKATETQQKSTLTRKVRV